MEIFSLLFWDKLIFHKDIIKLSDLYQNNVLALIVCFFSLFPFEYLIHLYTTIEHKLCVCMPVCSLQFANLRLTPAEKFLKITISYSKTPVFEFVGRFHEDFQPCLCYATHRSLVGLSPVFGAHATRISQ